MAEISTILGQRSNAFNEIRNLLSNFPFLFEHFGFVWPKSAYEEGTESKWLKFPPWSVGRTDGRFYFVSNVGLTNFQQKKCGGPGLY